MKKQRHTNYLVFSIYWIRVKTQQHFPNSTVIYTNKNMVN